MKRWTLAERSLLKRYMRINSCSVKESSFLRRGFREPIPSVGLGSKESGVGPGKRLLGRSVCKSKTELSKRDGLVVSSE